MKYFIYPLKKGICIYAYGKTNKTKNVLKLLETEYPCLIDCEKFWNIDSVIKELNFITGYTYKNINEYDFPLVFFGTVFFKSNTSLSSIYIIIF